MKIVIGDFKKLSREELEQSYEETMERLITMIDGFDTLMSVQKDYVDAVAEEIGEPFPAFMSERDMELVSAAIILNKRMRDAFEKHYKKFMETN